MIRRVARYGERALLRLRSPQSKVRNLAEIGLVFSLIGVAVACGTGDSSEEPRAEARSSAVGVSPLVFPEHPSASAGAGTGSASSETGGGPGTGSSATGGSVSDAGGSLDIVADGVRQLSQYCGDGAHDPQREECDDGNADANDLCTSNCQTRDRLAVVGGNASSLSRKLGYGRHPVAGSVVLGAAPRAGGLLSYTESGGATVGVYGVLLDRKGNPTAPRLLSIPSRTPLAANSVVAGLGDGGYVALWNDLNGDGAELGVAMRKITLSSSAPGDFSTATLGTVAFANSTTLGAQQDPDAVWSNGKLYVAWLDTSDPDTAPDLKLRTFSESLSPIGGELDLASGANPETAVALTAWNGSFAAVYREADDVAGAETIVVASASKSVRVTPSVGIDRLAPGGAEDRPAIAALDADHVFVAFTVGTDPLDSGTANVFRLWGAVVNLASGSLGWSGELTPRREPAASRLDLSQRQPALVSVNGEVYVAYRQEGALADVHSEDLWLRRLDWNGTSLDATYDEVSLYRGGWEARSLGDQRTPALGFVAIDGGRLPERAALAMSWEDFGLNFAAATEAKPDVALSVEPLPLRRGPPVEKDCASVACGPGDGPCSLDSQCEPGLVCALAGTHFGLGAGAKVCTLPSCVDGLLNGDETALDCGGSCGRCFECLEPVAFSGTSDFCNPACPCGSWVGDCDRDEECAVGLSCLPNTGAIVGLPSEVDLCAVKTCLDGVFNGTETRLDCGGPDCRACVKGTDNYCSPAVPCVEGDGKCSSDAECVSGLVCRTRDAALYGYPAGTGVCVAPTCEDRGASNVAGFCSTACRCPDGFGECKTNADCIGGYCAPERGLYYGLPTNFGMCEAHHCVDGLKNYDETGIDCGGSCGTECPACPVNTTFQSFEEPLGTWKLPDWASGTPSIGTSTDSTSGTNSLKYFGCGYQEIWTSTFPSSRFSIVGTELRVDVKYVVANPANLGPGAWLGSVQLKLRLPNGTETTLYPETHSYKGVENQWLTLKMPISSALKAELLGSSSGYRLQMALNRPCSGGPESILVDNLRFAGQAVFRSDCESNGSGGSSGTGGSSGAGGSSGTGGGANTGGSAGTGGSANTGGGGTGGSATGGVGNTGGAAGTGGASTGGASGTGGAGTGGSGTGGTGGSGGTPNAALNTLDFEPGSGWTSSQQPTTLTPSEKTHGTTGLEFSTSFGTQAEYLSPLLKAADISEASLLLVDVKVPAAAPYNSIGGYTNVILECPSTGTYWADFGSASLAGLPPNTWSTLSLKVPAAAYSALASNATDCKFHFIINIWGNGSGAKVYADNLRFTEPAHCDKYTQQTAPPYSLGMPVAPNGTAANPYPLCTAAQIANVAATPSLWSKHFALKRDIDLTSMSGSVGTVATPFTGTFDGQGHTLNHATVTGTTNVGPFGVVTGDGNLDGVGDGYIHDVTYANIAVTGGSAVGGVVGSLNGGRLVRVSVSGGSVSGTLGDIGGLVGFSSGRIEDSLAAATVTGANVTRLGGVVGSSNGLVLRTSSVGIVGASGSSSSVGGLAGESSGILDSTFSSASVTCAASRCGGLVGLGSGTISASESEGSVTSNAGDSLGGLVGEWTAGTIDKSFSGSLVDAAGSRVGGLVGYLSGGVVSSCRALALTLAADGSDVGGLVGIAASGATITRSWSQTSIETLGAKAGGLVGTLAGATLQDAYSTGNVTASTGTAGGVVGSANGATLTRVYSTGVVTLVAGVPNVGRLGGAFTSVTTTSCLTSSDANPTLQNVGNAPAQSGIQPVTAAQLKNQSTYVGWDFTNIWLMNAAGAGLR